MESSKPDIISDLKVETKFNQYQNNLINPIGVIFSSEDNVCIEGEADEEHERKMRDKLEVEITEAELKDVELKYIPDSIRKLRNKRDHWEKEYHKCSDPIADKNWRQYEKQLNKEIIKHKTVLKNLDKEQNNGKDCFNLAQSLDPERIQSLVDYIKQKETNNKVLEAMMSAAVSSFDLEQYAYVRYAIYARYRVYRCRPSRLRL